MKETTGTTSYLKYIVMFLSLSITILSINVSINSFLGLFKSNKDLLFALIERIEADKNRNIIFKFRYDILDTHTFKYEDNRVHNPYGRKGKELN